MRAESSAGKGTIWPTGSGIFTTWPSTDSISPTSDLGRQAAAGAPGQEQDPAKVSPALILGNPRRRHGLTQAQMAGPRAPWLPARASRGRVEPQGQKWLQRGPRRSPQAACPGQALGPGTAGVLIPAPTRPLPGPRPHTITSRVTPQHSLPPGTQQCSPARQRSPQSRGCHLHPQHEQTTFPPASPCPPTTRAGDTRQPSLPTPDPSLSPWPPSDTHTQAARASSQHVARRRRPRLRSSPHQSPGAPTGCPRTPPPGNASAQEAFGITPLRSLPQAFVLIALLA